VKRLWSLTAAAVVSSSVLAAVGPFAAQADTVKQAGDAAKQVALRPAIELLGGTLAWDQTTKSVKVLVRDAELLVTPGKDEVTVDGATQRMPAPAELRSDTTYVPEAFMTALTKQLNGLRITHSVASGDVTAKSAIIWGRASGTSQMHVEYATDQNFAHAQTAAVVDASPTADYTAQVKLEGLKPATAYLYRVWFTGTATDGSTVKTAARTGTFRTLPAAGTSQPLSFVFWGDLGGQQYCRRVDTGYDIFAKMQGLKPDFAIANGDSIYADGDCPANGPVPGWQNIPGNFPRIDDPSVDWNNVNQVTDNYQKHWKYHRKDPALELLMSSVPSYTQWDDHEVINDFGAQWLYQNEGNKDRTGFPNLVKAGRDTFFNYSPIDRNAKDPNQIYRSFAMGKEADLFILDARSYRSRNDVKDTAENQKTMLGAQQVEWLKQSLLKSTATWKVITSDIPQAFETGADQYGRDAWATDPKTLTGVEREQLDIMKFLDDHNIKNVVFLATDVHYTANVQYEKDLNGDGKPLVFHELVTGPVNAVRGGVGQLSPTLNPKTSYAEGNLFNFGYVQIRPGADGTFHLIADVRGVDGQVRPGSVLDLTPQAGGHQGNQQDGNQQNGNH
jgi:alkaline phosphatase D